MAEAPESLTEGLGLPLYALKGLIEHKQPNSDATEGYLRVTPEPLREPAQQVEDRLLKLARVGRGQSKVAPERLETSDKATCCKLCGFTLCVASHARVRGICAVVV